MGPRGCPAPLRRIKVSVGSRRVRLVRPTPTHRCNTPTNDFDTISIMTKLATLALLAMGVAAQQAINTTELGQIADALNAAGLTSLATAAASIANTTVGTQLLSILTNGDQNYTIFAPTDKAISSGNKTVLGDPDQLANVLSYHVVPGTYGNSTVFYASPNNTIVHTLLNSTDSVNLPGNASQVLSVNVKDGDVFVNGQGSTVKVANFTTVGRFSVLQIDHVLTPPGSLADVAKAQKLTLFAQAVEQANLTDLLSNAKGVTIFAPTDEALTAALASLGADAQNQTIVSTILQNHIINGSAIYSTEFDSKNFTSAAGEALNFYVANNTINVYSGSGNNITAKITSRDNLASNGVIHVIDAVLANTARDDNAASSAYSSATDSANNAKPTDGGNNSPVGGGPGNDAGGAADARMHVAWTAVLGAAFVGMLAATTL
ncbi:FAS1 domain-containing protein [Auriculariales sp. MPI-PUGE-AT-0066]|nr:FAS1 domain-containing protein [Auriculariales sp. MPI-PUGE-AT-0066]